MKQWDDGPDVDGTFRRLFATLPVVEPSARFVQAAVDAAWEARAYRQRLVRRLGAAAAVVVVSTALLVGAVGVPQWVLSAAGEGAAATLMGIVWSATAVAEFWMLMLRGGSALARVLAMPQSVALLVTVEVIGAVALYTLHRLLRSDIRFRNTGPLCI